MTAPNTKPLAPDVRDSTSDDVQLVKLREPINYCSSFKVTFFLLARLISF